MKPRKLLHFYLDCYLCGMMTFDQFNFHLMELSEIGRKKFFKYYSKKRKEVKKDE